MTITKSVEENLKIYAAEVIQRRALVDVRDGLKPSLRQVLYALHSDKINSSRPAISTLKLLGSAMIYYTHGDSSLTGIIMRAAQGFLTRYPLIEIKGNSGGLTDPGSYAHPRYTTGRLSELSDYLFANIEKDTIDTWYDNYDNTSKFPAALPSLGFWGLTNGTFGIGVAMSSSVPSFNLVEMNKALVAELFGNDYDLPLPDFPAGGTLINKTEVLDSLEKGRGASAIIQSKITYIEEENVLLVEEIPPLTYTNKISEQLEELLNEDKNCPYDRFLDITGVQAKIKIFLKNSILPQMAIQYLYKNTLLQNHYPINLTILDTDGHPKEMGLRTAMRRYLEHQVSCLTTAYEFDLKKLKHTLHILEGLLKASSHMDEIIKIVRASKDRAEAAKQLMITFEFSKIQVDHILKMTLQQLTKFDVTKVQNEHDKTLLDIDRITIILSDVNLIKEEIKRHLTFVANKFGDGRRTLCIDRPEDAYNLIYFYSDGTASLSAIKDRNAISISLPSEEYFAVTRKGIVHRTLITPKRRSKMFKIDSDDSILSVFSANPSDYLLILSKDRNFRCLQISSLNKTKTTLSLETLTHAEVSSEKVTKADFLKKIKNN